MKNGDKPINPISGKISELVYPDQNVENDLSRSVGRLGGLTKREYFAGLAMQAILSNPEFLRNYQNVDIHIASVKNADHLLRELEK